MLLFPQTCEDFKSLLHSVFTYLPLLPKRNFSSYILDTIILVNEDDTLAVIQTSLLFPCASQLFHLDHFLPVKNSLRISLNKGLHFSHPPKMLLLNENFWVVKDSTRPGPEFHAVGLRSCLSVYYSCFSC